MHKQRGSRSPDGSPTTAVVPRIPYECQPERSRGVGLSAGRTLDVRGEKGDGGRKDAGHWPSPSTLHIVILADCRMLQLESDLKWFTVSLIPYASWSTQLGDQL